MEVKGQYQKNNFVQQKQVENNKQEKISKSENIQESRVKENTEVGGYKTSISDKYEDYQKSFSEAFKIAKNTSPVREDRVKELKEKIESGNYKVDSGKIADGILREAIMNHLAENPESID